MSNIIGTSQLYALYNTLSSQVSALANGNFSAGAIPTTAINSLNSSIAAIQATDTNQSNQILAIQAVDVTQNNQIVAIQAVDAMQNTQITAIQAVDNIQNTQIAAIQALDANQNTTMANLQAQINAIDAAGSTLTYSQPYVLLGSDGNKNSVTTQITNNYVADAALSQSKVSGLSAALTAIGPAANAYAQNLVTPVQNTVASQGLAIGTLQTNAKTDEANIAGLTTQAGVFNTGLNAVTTTANNNTAAITTINSTLTNNQVAITSNTNAIATLNTRAGTDESTISGIQASLGTVTSKQSADENNITNLQNQMTNANSNITLNTGSINTLINRITADETTTSTLQTQVTSISNSQLNDETTIAGHTSSITALQNRATADESLITTAGTNIGNLQSNVTALQNLTTNQGTLITNNTSAINAIQSKQVTDETNITSVTTSASNNAASIVISNQNIATNATNITTLQTGLATANNNINTANANITANGTLITALQTRATADETSITALQTRATNDETNITSNTAAILALQTRATTDEGNITASQGNITTLQGNVLTLQSSVSSNTANITTNTNNITTANSNISGLQTRIATDEQTTSNLITRIANDETTVTNLQTSLTTLKNVSAGDELLPPVGLNNGLIAAFSTWNPSNYIASGSTTCNFWYPYAAHGNITPFFTTSSVNANRPTWKANNLLTSRYMLSFSGTGGLLNTSFTTQIGTGTSNVSTFFCFFVFSPQQSNSQVTAAQSLIASDGGYGRVFDLYDSRDNSSSANTAGGYYPAILVGANNGYVLSLRGSSGTGNRVNLVANTWYLGCMAYVPIVNTTAGSLNPNYCVYTWLDGALTTNGANCAAQDGTTRIAIGCSSGSTSNTDMGADSSSAPGIYAFANVSDVLFYNRVLNTSERQSIEQYLKTKWNLPFTLSGI